MAESSATLFDPFPEQARAYAEMARAAGECKLKAAQADLVAATAAGDWARARALEALAAQLEADLDALARSRAATGRRVHALAEQAHAASMLLRGSSIAAYTRARDAYKAFEKSALVGDGGDALFAADVAPGSVTGDQFLDNRDPGRPCDDPPQNGRPWSPLRLVDWALSRGYVARTGTPAQREFLRVFRQVAETARGAREAAEAAGRDLRRETLDTWKPARLLAAAPTPAEARLLETALPPAPGADAPCVTPG